MDTIHKISTGEVKKIGERKYEFTASDSSLDRDNEVIDVTGWDLKNFKKNPVIMYAHNYSGLPVGRATSIRVKDGLLKNTVEFPPEGTYEFADIVERLVSTGYLKTESVGFQPRKWEDGDGDKTPRRTYKEQELLEISIVPVPSNPNALMNAVEEGVITAKQFEAISKQDETYECECIRCGHKLKSDKHCKDIKCPECGGKMRRVERPGPGEEGIEESATKLEVPESKLSQIEFADEGKVYKLVPDDIDELAKESTLELDRPTSQEEILDEIDYLKDSIEEMGLSENGKKAALELVETIKRITGNDIPDDIKREDEVKRFSILEHKDEIKALFKEFIEEAQGKV